MLRFLMVLFFISINILFAKPINFSENKYISALEASIEKSGQIIINEDSIELKYSKEKKHYIFKDDLILLKEEDKTTQLSYDENIDLTIFSKLIKSIYKNDSQELIEYFSVQKDEKTTLIPNEYVANVIEKIEYKKNKEFLVFLTIYFTNEDRIEIVQNKELP